MSEQLKKPVSVYVESHSALTNARQAAVIILALSGCQTFQYIQYGGAIGNRVILKDGSGFETSAEEDEIKRAMRHYLIFLQ